MTREAGEQMSTTRYILLAAVGLVWAGANFLYAAMFVDPWAFHVVSAVVVMYLVYESRPEEDWLAGVSKERTSRQ